MPQSLYETTKLSGILARRRDMDRDYLHSLTAENLLLPYYLEAGLRSVTYLPDSLHGGWDSPLSEIRGTVCGHWLSAVAMLYAETGDAELKARADFIVDEIGRCQEENGGEWCFSIPEKYLHWLKRGKTTWAPQYVCHKTMMGLMDMYRCAGNGRALEIVKKAAGWFLRFSEDIGPAQMARMMRTETGGILELWADLYGITGEAAHLALVRRYERRDLYDALLAGRNPLCNQHANSTIPEMHGAARAYEVTGEEFYRRVVERYWELAVDGCVPFVTGGQTAGEAWTPPGRQDARLGRMNQEHCTVYNMMRLADYLFRWTGDSKYADYWEKNLYNGIFAQGFYREWGCCQCGTIELYPRTGYVAYYLPLEAGARKVWGSATGDFWCCHCSLMQANVYPPHSLYYREGDTLLVNQYQDSSVTAEMSGVPVTLRQETDPQAGEIIDIQEVNERVRARPGSWRRVLRLSTERPTRFVLALRVPDWLDGGLEVEINGVPAAFTVDANGYARIDREWKEQTVTVTLPKALRAYPLADRPDMVAFKDGPVALAGLISEERTLYYRERPEEILVPADERRWGEWLNGWKTAGQPVNLRFLPLYEIGCEPYTTYFPVERRDTINE